MATNFDHAGLIKEQFSPEFLQIGKDFSIYWYAVLILTGAVLGYFFSLRQARKMKLTSDSLSFLFVLGIVIGILGGRIWYYIGKPSEFKSFGAFIDIRSGGLAIHGVLASVVIYAVVVAYIRKMNFLFLLDMIVVSVLIGQMIGRWGNFFNHEAHGGLVPGATLDAQRAFLKRLWLPEFIINNMYMESSEISSTPGYYHPTFLYESLTNLLGITLILILRRTVKKFYIGDSLFVFLIWWGVFRFLIEITRTDALLIGKLKMAQIASIVNVVIGIVGIIVRHAIKYKPISFNDYMAAPYTKGEPEHV